MWYDIITSFEIYTDLMTFDRPNNDVGRQLYKHNNRKNSSDTQKIQRSWPSWRQAQSVIEIICETSTSVLKLDFQMMDK